jgi:hypothetical protein
MNRPMVINYAPSTLSVGTMIGYIFTPTVTWTNLGLTSIASQSITQGIYNLTCSVSCSGTYIKNFLYITGTVIPDTEFRIPFVDSAAGRSIACGSCVIKVNSTSTFNLVNYEVNTQALANGYCYITRIG